MVQTPPPPSISPRQMNLLRIVTAMAWADGGLAETEANLMLDRFSRIFAQNADQQQHLRQELQDYMMQNIPLSELVPQLQSTKEKELVLRLGYEVICSSSRVPSEDRINTEEAAALYQLVMLLDLPSSTVERIEAEAAAALSTDKGNLVDSLTNQLQNFMR